MTKLSSAEIRRFIMNSGYFANPKSLPAVADRHYHAGMAHADMSRLVGKKRTPAYSRIEREFNRLQARGWLEYVQHPDYPPIWGWSLAPALVDGFNVGVIRWSDNLFEVTDQQAVLLKMVGVDPVANL